MSTVLNLYEVEPKFPATEQNPAASRHAIDIGIFRFADCAGGAPTQAELEAHLGLDATGQANKTRLEVDEAELANYRDDPVMQQVFNSTKADVDSWVASQFPGMNATNRARFAAFIWGGILAVRREARAP